MSNPILTKSSGDKVSSPEQLNDYIKVSNVGVWLILSIIFILLISVIIWAFTGSLKTTVSATGVSQNGTVVCYVENKDKISVGDEVNIEGAKGEVVSIAEEPVSAQTVSSHYDEYTAYSLNLSEWNYKVEISCDDSDDGLNTVKIICDSVKPISFIVG